MFEDIEGISSAVSITDNGRNIYSASELSYVNECVEAQNPSALVARIDEISPFQPPKGVDYDAEMAELIDPVKDSIESKYLEAPSDIEQAMQIGDFLSDVEDLRHENWCKLDVYERRELLQGIENKVAEIEHREPCLLKFSQMEERNYGAFSPTSKDITLNSIYVESNDFCDYVEIIDTLIHEGRHAYQDYNVEIREVHRNGDETLAWSYNIDHYISPDWDFQAYSEQPIEQDADNFAKNVVDQYLNNAA